MRLIKNPVEFEEKLRQAQSKEATTIQPKQKELEHVIALLEETEVEAEEIARAICKARGIIAAKLQHQADEAVAAELENPTFEDKRRWLEILQTTVTVKEGTAVVTCRLGGNSMNYRLTEFQIQHNLYTGF
jgi:hypothetical protein